MTQTQRWEISEPRLFSMMKHYEKLLEGITVEQLHDHRGLKFPLQYVGSAMGPTAFRQPQ